MGGDKIDQQVKSERYKLLKRVEAILEPVLIFLGFIWLLLIVIDLVRGLPYYLVWISTIIWVIFILDFILKVIIAPQKWIFIKKSWLTILSLIVPALRIFRLASTFNLLRTVRFARGTRLIKVLGSANRGMRSLAATMERRAFGYVVLLSVIVILIGAAGMFFFEAKHGLDSYAESIWWTAMIITTMGSDIWPQTPEGRILCFILAIYGFAVFGYFTATLATFFIGRDAEDKNTEVAGSSDIKQLNQDLKVLMLEIKKLREEKQTDKE
jgi:voltage-gated potassium channel